MKYSINHIRYGNARERIGNGGFPSNHTTIMTTTVMFIGLREGFTSPLFGLGTAVTFIVIMDAMGLRRYVGHQARLINGMNAEGNKLRESVGHKPVEILGGLMLGGLLAYAMNRIVGFI